MANSTQKKSTASKKSSTAQKKKEPEIPKKTTSSASNKTAASKAKKEEPVKSQDNLGKQQGTAIILIAVAAFIGAVVFIEGESFWSVMHTALFGIFGFCAYLIPVVILYLGIMFARNRNLRSLASVVISSVFFTVILCALIHLIKQKSDYLLDTVLSVQIKDVWEAGNQTLNGGVVGALIGGLIAKFFGKTGAVITFVILSVVALMFLTGITLPIFVSYVKRFFRTVTVNTNERFEENARKREEQRLIREQEEELKAQEKENENNETDDIKPPEIKDEIPPTINNSPKISDKKVTTLSEPDMPETPKINVADLIAPAVPSVVSDAAAGTAVKTAVETTVVAETVKSVSKAAQKVKKTNKQKDEPAAEKEIEKKPDTDYVKPPLSCLDKPNESGSVDSLTLMQSGAEKLVETLESFGIKADVTNIVRGPSVTRYELVPAAGVRISKIENLEKDIKLRLAAQSIRIEAPIPGKAAVGIEVPNEAKATVTMREIIDSEAYIEGAKKSKVSVALGKDITGNIVTTDIAKMPHLLVAGTTGSGKSVCINTVIMSILYHAHPDDVKFIMIDPKVVELSIYNGIPHLLLPVVTDPKKAAGALNWAVAEMTDRYRKFAEYQVKDIKAFNQKVDAIKDIPGEKPERMPQILIIVDELADLMMVAPGDVEGAICRLAQLARAAGIHLVIATQRPSVNVITGLIKANMPSRIAFAVTSGVDSRTILDMVGAEKLLGKGDMLFYPQDYQKPLRVQGAFISEKEINAVVKEICEKNGNTEYGTAIQEQMEKASGQAGGGSAAPGKERDVYFDKAGRFVIEKEKGSIGMLQRMFKIGFNRAARIMDQLEEAGVVGPEEGTKPRQVLMSAEEFEAYLSEIE